MDLKDYDKCMLEKRCHDLADAPVPSAMCEEKFKESFSKLDKCYKKYADGFDPGTWHGCEKGIRKEHILYFVEKYNVAKLIKE